MSGITTKIWMGSQKSLAVEARHSVLDVQSLNCDGIAGWKLPDVRADVNLTPQFPAVIQGAFDIGYHPETVSMGVSGLLMGPAHSSQILEAALLEGTWEFVFAHDSAATYLGALGRRSGKVTACTTGIVTLAVGLCDVARVNSWGYPVEDADKEFWLSRSLLDSTLRAHEGRGESTPMTDDFAGDYSDLDTAHSPLQPDRPRVSRTTRNTRRIIDIAEDDPATEKLVRAPTREVALSATTAVHRSGKVLLDPLRSERQNRDTRPAHATEDPNGSTIHTWSICAPDSTSGVSGEERAHGIKLRVPFNPVDGIKNPPSEISTKQNSERGTSSERKHGCRWCPSSRMIKGTAHPVINGRKSK